MSLYLAPVSPDASGLCRRFLFGGSRRVRGIGIIGGTEQIEFITPGRLEACDTAGWKPALQRAAILATLLLAVVGPAGAAEAPSYDKVQALFAEHCLDCHGSQDPEGKLDLETFGALMKGGDSGQVVVPGKSAESLLVKFLEGKSGREGKNQFMPPGKRKHLSAAEITTVKAWIDAGATGPEGDNVALWTTVPKIAPKVAPRRAIKAMAYAPQPDWIATATYGEVQIRSAKTRELVRTLTGHRGSVNGVVFSKDGGQLFAAAGVTGVFGEVRQWDASKGELIRIIEGHKDSLYAVALSPDGTILATGSYDQKIKLWNTATGVEIRTLSGHNGCIFDLAFRPDGKILASASADRTVKLWDVASGERRDTFSQPTKEVYCVAFSPDGKRLLAGGVDNRIRIWQISEAATETSNPLLDAKFAHEGAILKIAFSPDGRHVLSSADDRTVKLWDAAEVKERLPLEKQPDWAPALAFIHGNSTIALGRMDGSIAFYDVKTGKPLAAGQSVVAR
ncbi:MAG: c-type cytochrome domain-containing protein [Verrucomicrobiota bacterium]